MRGEGFNGRMTMSGKYAVICNELDGTSWLFKIRGNLIHEKLSQCDIDGILDKEVNNNDNDDNDTSMVASTMEEKLQ